MCTRDGPLPFENRIENGYKTPPRQLRKETTIKYGQAGENNYLQSANVVSNLEFNGPPLVTL